LSGQDQSQRRTVVFVCEHGSVKSVVAMEWFNRLAREGGLKLQAVSRGVTPDAAIPGEVEQNLVRDGFRVTGFKPRRLSPSELREALLVVGIGVDSQALADSCLSGCFSKPPYVGVAAEQSAHPTAVRAGGRVR
jgi:protein-tyrosine-phosphatase